MTTKRLSIISKALPLTVVLLLAGCVEEEQDARLERVVHQSLQQQATQSRDNAYVHQHVSEGAKRLVEADAKARHDLIALQHELRSDQAAVGQQRDLLEQERRNLAAARQWDSSLAAAAGGLFVVLACLSPLVLAGYLVYLATRTTSDAGVEEILIRELTSLQPVLLSPTTRPALPAADVDNDRAGYPVP